MSATEQARIAELEAERDAADEAVGLACNARDELRKRWEAAERYAVVLEAAIRRHRDMLDARALGHPEHVKRDRDDIDNDLYNATIPGPSEDT